MSTTPHCPDCETEMETGFIPDNTFLGEFQTKWHPGDPESAGGTFFGMKVKNRTQTVKVDESQMRKVITYRCPACGLLRSYAE
ncbi:hypothetical protein Pan153_29150 [Gimesia panareensis]|uniref:DUF6487 domain-containing protein n=1 Tax=Gimesia panareensis TaxID=2527978 RepID=A0A518FPI6_9PLAN|nr:PF20097 family protein [Gimesia panareensis]QDV18258.1 hypothetical protein Pan153_29150 [Gimesia panareensis]